ncbi:acyl-CoA thioesterase [Spirosoma montaniterrae]|uniref:Acyl-CoA thioesterase n=1 Tax=Spirosoma montaniterrae TaxID=1178516 RepID=A0A1P9X0T9_9BACT|nr:acyl-CoA thioesterase [Spirosoma montaniterrae]AQG81251.1 acyl-CoA thioesterase [Spirosoma montaniterrae]
MANPGSDDSDGSDPKPVSYSRTTLTELMIPSYANFGGRVHGGILLSLMDKVAYACAAKHAGTYCVTVSVDGVNFRQPVEVGELVSLMASVNYVGRTSLVVGIKVIAENVKTGVVKHTNTSYFTMVAKDDNENPTEVPPLLLETPEDARRFLETMKRRELRASYAEHFDNAKTRMLLSENLSLLAGERCVVLNQD